eukprot:XP_011661237.1 PREDICTED: laccase-2 [Strongylocentrotus purpuratus]
MLNGEGTSIHWHGFPQKNSPYMDGVSMVTQCPITEFTSFRYEFVADHSGTHWWHAHAGMHRADGLFGALIVREPREVDQQSALFDYDLSEHVIITHDWLDQVTLDKFAAHHFDDGSNRPESVLINGKGKRAPFYDETSNETVYTAREIFHVKQGFRYRFRIASNAITNAPLKVSVDGHNLTIISSEGGDIEPVDVDAFVIYAGERFDFVVNANQTTGNYWLRVKGLADAIAVQELAILRYEGALSADPMESELFDRDGIILQDLNVASSDTVYTYDQMISKDASDIPQENKKTFYLAFDFYKVNNYAFHDPEYYPIEEIARSHHLYSPQMNHVSFNFFSAPPLSQEVDPSELCDANDVLNMTHCATEYCACTQVLTVELGETVEIVLIDEGLTFDASHPFHLHGYSFYVVGQEKLNSSTSLQEVMELDKLGEGLPRNLDHPPLKDTVIVPDGGYTIIQFVADNPGWWFLHCHLEFHVAIGMGMLIHVGTDEDLPPVPENFPRCGNWPSSFNQPIQPTDDTEQPMPCTGRGNTLHPNNFITIFSLSLAILFVLLHPFNIGSGRSE